MSNDSKGDAPKMVHRKKPLSLSGEAPDLEPIAEPVQVTEPASAEEPVTQLGTEPVAEDNPLEDFLVTSSEINPEDSFTPPVAAREQLNHNPAARQVRIDVRESQPVRKARPTSGPRVQHNAQSTRGASSNGRKRPFSWLWGLLPVATFVLSFVFFNTFIGPTSPAIAQPYPVPATSGNAEVPVCKEGNNVVWFEPATGSHVLAQLPNETGESYLWIVPGSSKGELALSASQVEGLASCR